MTMDCKEAKQKIFEAIDGGLEDRTELDTHLEQCASCRSEYRQLMEVQEGLTDLVEPGVEPPDDKSFAEAVMAKLGDEAPGDEDPLADAVADPDTSGMRDIRQLAALAGGEEAGESMSDFFGLKHQDEAGPSIEVPAVVPPPVLMPMETKPTWLRPAILFGGFLVLALVALAAVLFLKHGRKSRLERAGTKPAVASADETGATAGTKEHRTPRGEVARPSVETPRAEGAARQVPGNPVTGAMGPHVDQRSTAIAHRVGTSDHHSARRNSNRLRTRRHAASPMARRSVPRQAKARDVPDFTVHARKSAEGPAKATGSNDPLAALLSKGHAGKTATQKESATQLPATLTTSQIRRVMRKATSAMKRCYEINNKPGMLTVRVTVKGATGRISSLSVTGKFRGTPTARCAVKALRRLKFPRFSAPSQKFSYPYLLR